MFIFTGLADGAYDISGFTQGKDLVAIETNTGGLYDAPLGGAIGALAGADFYAAAEALIAAGHPTVGFAYATDTHALTFWSGGVSTALGTINVAGGAALAASDIRLTHA